MFDVAGLVADAMRDIERRDGQYLAESAIKFNASFILGGQISGEPLRLFRIYAEGNFIEAGLDTPYLQTGETKYGKPIIDRVITRSTTLADAAKCVLVSFDSTMRSNLSIGMPIDLICYRGTLLKCRCVVGSRRGMRISPRLAVNGAKVCDTYSASCPSCLGNLTRYIDIGSTKLYSRVKTLGEIKRIATCTCMGSMRPHRRSFLPSLA